MATIELVETIAEKKARVTAEKKTKVAEKPEQYAARKLAEEIGALHREIEPRAEQIRVLLKQARDKHTGWQTAPDGTRVHLGGWLAWLADNRETLGFGERQAQLYLREPALRNADREANRQRVAAHREREHPQLTAVRRVPPPMEIDGQIVMPEGHPLHDSLPAHFTANRNPEPRADGKPDRRYLVNQLSQPEPRVRQQIDREFPSATDAMVRLLDAIEQHVAALGPQRIEALGTIWDRIGALLERWGHDGDRPKMREVEAVEA